MKTLKPMRLGVLARPYTWQGRHQVGVAVLALASLRGEPVLALESELWTMAGSELGEDGTLDLGIPKPTAEFLVSGRAYTRHQADRGRCVVRAGVAGRTKDLMVFGARHWEGGRASAPEPFDGLPLSWAHAYGGPDVPENPAGMGTVPDERGVVPLPHVEPMEGRLTHPRQAGVPVGLGPVPPVRPSRFARAGRYDPGWLEQGFPGFPDTMDPHFFNAAPPDQWLDGCAGLDPAAPYELWNLHPDAHCLRGRLPGWRARCFVRRAGGEALEEVDMRLTTAWFFPDRDRVLLIHHGAAPARRDDGADLDLLLPALEAPGHARPQAHYERVARDRLHPEFGGLHALNDRDVLPGIALADLASDAMRQALSRPLAVNQRARGERLREEAREQAARMGFDPRTLVDGEGGFPGGDPGLPDMEDMAAFVRGLRQRAWQGRQAIAQARAQAVEQEARIAPPAASSGASETARHAEAARRPGGGLGRLRALAASAGDAQAESLLRDAAPRLADAYRLGAHHRDPAPAASGTRTRRMRARIIRLMQGSRNLSGLDLTGMDLSGLDLAGAQCRGALMEGADLTNVRLAGADLRDAVLTRARLAEADLSGADLSGANLGGAVARGADFSGARLHATVLHGAVLAGSVFREASLTDCTAPDADVMDCDFAQARLDNVTFWQGARCSRLAFHRAELSRVVWLGCELADLDFGHARMVGCAWVQSAFWSPPRFDHARMETCCAVDTDMPGASFAHARLQECSFRDIDLAGARFEAASLRQCDFAESALGGADLLRADARGSLFTEADLAGARLRHADLIEALMQRCDLRGSDLQGANLFRADVSQARLDGGTVTAGAYTRLMKTLPAAEPGA